MQFVSTRAGAQPAAFSDALRRGLAEDGGLYVPQKYPRFEISDFDGAEQPADIAALLLAPFFAGDVLEPELAAICRDAFGFPLPLRDVHNKARLSVLELFHGPTAAFKDVGAAFLAACMQRLEGDAQRPLKVLVATSGDTGGAVAAAFHSRSGIEVYVLYPAGMVSPRQEQQLTCWGDNVRAFRVSGVFDDCQRLVKQAFADTGLRAEQRLTSANSISIGRLLPQAVYYAAASLWHYRRCGREPSFIVPTGNLGNAVACVWARHMGLPINQVVLATNANRVIPDFLTTGVWEPRQSLATLASAMDVGDPSNMERLRHLYPKLDDKDIAAWAVDDEQIRRQILTDYNKCEELWCPHTATAAYVHENYLDDAAEYIMVATAHPAKFETVIEPLIGSTVAVPPALERLLHLPQRCTDLETGYAAFRQALTAA
ncbi:MAG: threonine synthase [Gammaproteobacteria bacterium]|nr:threonine synthase [Gammaproteobacteria bacterium]